MRKSRIPGPAVHAGPRHEGFKLREQMEKVLAREHHLTDLNTGDRAGRKTPKPSPEQAALQSLQSHFETAIQSGELHLPPSTIPKGFGRPYDPKNFKF